MLIDELQLRRKIGAKLDILVADDQWAYLKEWDYVEDALNAPDIDRALGHLHLGFNCYFLDQRRRVPVQLRQGSRRVGDSQVKFESNDVLRRQALGEYFAKLASGSTDVRRFRQRFLGDCRFSDYGLDLYEKNQTPEQIVAEHPVPIERILTDDEAQNFLQSPAVAILSLEQFQEWNVPAVGHRAAKGIPAGFDVDLSLDAVMPQQGLFEVITFFSDENQSEVGVYLVRMPDINPTIEGLKLVSGRQIPSYPIATHCSTTREVSIAMMLADGRQEWIGEMTDEDVILIPKVRKYLEDKHTFVPVGRQVNFDFEKTLEYPVRRVNSKTGEIRWFPGEAKVWPGSVLDRLRIISENLSKRFHWYKASATWFVLTGQEPLTNPLNITRNTVSGDDFNDARVSIEASPWVSSKTVEKLYRQAQEDLHTRPSRLCDDTTIEVFRFVTHKAGADVSNADWRKLAREWRKTHPEDNKRGASPRLKQRYDRAKRMLLFPDFNK